jgi:hypothetical protein
MTAFSKANAAENAGGGASLLQAASGTSGSGVSNMLAAAMGEGQTSLADSGAGTSTSSDVSRPGLASAGGDTKAGTVPLGSQAQAASAQKDEGAPGEVKRGTALKAARSIAVKVGNVAAGTVGNLALGSWDVSKDKISGLKAGALDRIGESTGGQIAAAINARAAANKAVSFGGDSLSAADAPADRESEVAAFRDST